MSRVDERLAVWLNSERTMCTAHLKGLIVNWSKCRRDREVVHDLRPRQAEEAIRVVELAAQEDGWRCDLQSVLGSLDTVDHEASARSAHAGRRILVDHQLVLIADEEEVSNLVVDSVAFLFRLNVASTNDTKTVSTESAHCRTSGRQAVLESAEDSIVRKIRELIGKNRVWRFCSICARTMGAV